MSEETKKITITINDRELKADPGETVLQVAHRSGINIPHLCYLKDINEIAACRLCVAEVEVNGRRMRGLPATCVLKVEDGMVVRTNTKAVRKAVRFNLELILANHDMNCPTCVRNGTCELQKLARERGVEDVRFDGAKRTVTIDELSPSIVRDSSKCILCGRCVSTCEKIQGLGVLAFTNRGFDTEVGPAFDFSMRDVNCIYCGQCIEACPVAALRERRYIDDVWDAIDDPDKVVVVQTAPAVRASLGEEFGYPIGTPVTGKMTAALRHIGFDYVFDTNFAADLTISEEATELLHRITTGGVLPMITSCSPGWIRYCEMYHPDFLPNLSTCKSPQNMMGAIIKSYFADVMDIDAEKIVVVSVMPCTSKKSEAIREEMEVDGLRDVDYSLTTRELGDMIKQAGIDFDTLEDEHPDSVLGDYTGAAVIFGATGGVMEAALRTAADVLTGEDLPSFEYEAVRGLEGIKQASVTVPLGGVPTELKVVVCSSVKHAGEVLDAVRKGELSCHFIEVMACPGGCIHGGGQSYVSSTERMSTDPRLARANALYSEDERQVLRKSHQNPELIELIEKFLGAPNSDVAHKYLHTHYAPRPFYEQKAFGKCDDQ
ncbi:MAG: 2Fe-2S iron-sulfur cluster binding domain-containing protein [Clostridiaceae bacterium]|jgi:iron-only hydrogenase group A|nr:[FeFe] hydrogenase, group A [Clostridia bacterium]NMA36027.1 2Fe-2S iron-sulfur cluster binding domain-containing protein [Clostridiaceae bacterium]